MAGNGSRTGSVRSGGFKRSGQTIAIKRPRPLVVKQTKEDRAFEKLTQLKVGQRLFYGQPNKVFIAAKDMTPARRRQIGLVDRNGMPRVAAESPRWRASEFNLPNGVRGYVVGPRSGVADPRPAGRSGVIRRRR